MRAPRLLTVCLRDRSEFLVRVSYIEIYNEVISDLASNKPTTLRIHEDAARGVYVGGVSEEVVTTAEQVLQFMELGESRRHVSSTRMNDQSSRSHTLFRIMIESRVRAGVNGDDGDVPTSSGAASSTAAPNSSKLGKPSAGRQASAAATTRRAKESLAPAATSDEGGIVRVSQLNLVDLAGSERVSQTGAAGQQLREGGHINQSLLTLGTVIGKLADLADAGASAATAAAHIPYRDSKLTRILQVMHINFKKGFFLLFKLFIYINKLTNFNLH